ncbi:MAG TPA: ATP--guanido phosphotransferase [bacterium]|nr:ATP--guanido phosphotransferase [bacterium]
MKNNAPCAWNIIDRKTAWILENISSDTLISFRIRLARNLCGFPFPHNMTRQQAESVEKTITETLLSYRNGGQEVFIIQMNGISEIEKGFLFERHMISEELTDNHLPCSAVIFPREKISLMINEEDHLRIQTFCSGILPEDALASADKLDDYLGYKLPYAFSEKLGFLTACPTNIGTGLRASAILHIPALLTTGRAQVLFKDAEKNGTMVRGFYGEGSENMGGFYQVSSKETTGRNEKEIIENLQIVVNLIEKEEEESFSLISCRKKSAILRSLRKILEKRTMPSSVFFTLFSKLVLAKKLGIADFDIKMLRGLFFQVLPYHLQYSLGKKMSPEKRDAERSRIVRKQLRSLLNV